MQIPSLRFPAAFFAAFLCITQAHATWAQQRPTPTPTPNESDEVIRIASELVQTDLMVFDRQGSFVNGLKPEQFELRIDKKPRAILFFERITAGSANEEAQLAAARGRTSSLASARKGPVVPLDRGRTVFFYVDDVHLSAGSMAQARKMLLKFIDRDMGQNDEAAITSPSGQIGFLQQLTDNKSVLRYAVERLRARPFAIHDGERPAMTEYQALAIENNDPGVLGFFVDELVKQIPGVSNPDDWVRGRASRILAQADDATANSLLPLESLVANSKELPGRKLIFFVSDGFYLDPRRSAFNKLRRITNAAARSGAVIYTIDARGLVASLTDASTEGTADPTGRLAKAEIGQISASQDGLNALARDTGGRPLFNTNDLSSGVTRALKETSTYYLIAWHPESDEQRSGRFSRIEVSVVGRPDLVVRLRRTLPEKESPPTATKPKLPATPGKPGPDELRAAIRTQYPSRALATALVIEFLDAAGVGPTVEAAMQVTTTPENFATNEGKATANIDLGGAVFDTSGRVAASFRTRMTVEGDSLKANDSLEDNVTYNYRFKLKPGLYQVRVAARDLKSGRTGGARQWIEVPDLTLRKLVLSSVILGQRTAGANQKVSQSDPVGRADLSVDHRFSRTSNLRFLTFVYNAARRVGSSVAGVPDAMAVSGSIPRTVPDVAIQVQVLRDDQPVVTTMLRKIEIHPETDVARVPYAAELPLSDLQPGRYLLQVTVIDRIAKTSATQQTAFAID